MIGKVISHYKILSKLGEGGMGVVFKAEDTKLGRTVALKFLPPELTKDLEAKERFLHEARAASALDHPNICTVYEIEETDDGRMFMAMAFYEGQTLERKIESPAEGGGLKIWEGVELAIQIARGLAKAHESGIIHRDIKPANIIVTSDGVAKILDFGLAKRSGRTLLTRAGTTIGTVAYMSPEQARGDAVDSRTDIWSLGVILYEMLTGRRPFASDYEQAIVYSILNDEPSPARQLRSDIPEALEKILRRAMAKNLADRYQDLASFIADLDSTRAGAQLSKETRKLPGKNRRLAYLGVAAVVVLAVLVGLIEYAARAEAIDTIAVLPFVNESKNPDVDYLCDGLTEALLEDLCRAPGIRKVIARYSVMEYKNKTIVPSEVGQRLGVDALLVSRLNQRGDEARVSVELIAARDGSRLWGAQYTASESEITGLHGDISKSVIENLHLTRPQALPSRETRSYTQNQDAYRLYLQGQIQYHRTTDDGIRNGIECYRRALELDPKFALAYAGIAIAHAQLGIMDFVPWKQADDSVGQAVARAMEFDANLAETHYAMALKHYMNLDPQASEQEFKRCLELNPLSADAIHYYGHMTSEHGRYEEGIRLIRQSVELDPLSAHYQFCLGTVYANARRWDEALRELDRARAIDSTFSLLDFEYADVYFYTGKYDSSLAYARRWTAGEAHWPGYLDYSIARINAVTGRADDARRQILQMEEKATRADPALIGSLYSVLGEKDSAMTWLQRGYREHSAFFLYLKVWPMLDPLRDDPRFKELARSAGFGD